MNNRQKAKHWKRLYEERLPKKPYQTERKTPSFSYGDISDKSQYAKD